MERLKVEVDILLSGVWEMEMRMRRGMKKINRRGSARTFDLYMTGREVIARRARRTRRASTA